MSNTMLTITDVTNLSLMVLENELTFASEVLRDYDDRFGIDGAKIGDTVNVRRPARFVGTSGPNLNIEDYTSTSIPVVLGDTANYGDQYHIDTSFTTKDLHLSLPKFSDEVVQPAVAALANKVDRDGLLMAKNSVANIVGTPGTIPNALLTYLTAAAFLDSEAAPRDGKRCVVIEPFTGATIVDALKGLFVPEATLSQQFKKGLMGRDSGGMNWKMDQNVISHTFGSWAAGSASTLTTDTTGAFTGSLGTGWAKTSTITLTQGATLTLKKGDTFTIGNVLAVNPQNRQPYGSSRLRTFCVQADVTGTGSGTMSVTVAPAIITGGQFQNVQVAATSATATVTPTSAGVNGAGVVSPQNVLFHRNAFTMAMADLPLPDGVVFAGRASSKESNLSIRVVRQYTINNDQIPARLDVLYGWSPIYQELACRIAA